MAPSAFFLPVGTGERFCILHPAAPERRKGCVVYAHPFAEEMNKSRRMVALQASALADAGYAVLQLDLDGCGDSSGDFADASWEGWCSDVVRACRWMREQQPGPVWLWGLRAGVLVAAEAARRLDFPVNLLFWQPAVAGKSLLQQFLRLSLAAELVGGNSRGAMEALRRRIDGGEPVEIAGYTLAPGLALGLEQAVLAPLPATTTKVIWLEVSSRADATLAPVSEKTLEALRQSGSAVFARVANGPAFWQTSEIEEAPELIRATVDALSEVGP